MNKTYELDLLYFEPGEDLARASERFPNEPARAMRDQARMLVYAAEALRKVAMYVNKGMIKLHDQPEGHVIFMEAPEALGKRLVKEGIFREVNEDSEDEEDVVVTAMNH